MATLHLVEGPVGAGKSTFAQKLSRSLRAPHLDLDAWMVTLFSPDRPSNDFMAWYSDRKGRCVQQIWNVACDLLDTGTSTILELGLVRLADRDDFYRRVDATDYDLRVYLLDTPLAQRRQRVRQRNSQKSGSYKMEVSEEIFDLANSFWEEPTEAECRERNIEIVPTIQIGG
ncbi:MAG: AAA family ATPase [Pseudomonadales bacterium]